MENLFDLSGKVAVVTGTSRGLGQYFGRALAQAGADLVITSRDPARLTEFKEEIEGLGRRALPVKLDVLNESDIEAMVRTAINEYGRIDILVNNAGLNIRHPAVEFTWKEWDTVLNTNLKGAFFVAQAVGKEMIKRKYGRIVNIGSCTCVFGMEGIGPVLRQSRRHPANQPQSGRRMGQTRHHGQRPGPRLVQDRPEQGALRQ